MSTLLCVPITVRDAASALADAGAARALGADLVELRIDEVFHGEGDNDGERLVLRLVADCPLPCIVTCRSAAEGGAYDGDDAARVALYERLGTASGPGEHPPRYIDVELATYARSENIRRKINLAVDRPDRGRDLSTSLILSAHDFQGRPPDLVRRLLAMRAEPAAKVTKIAFRARSLRDNLELFDAVRESDRPMIALCMGEFGLMSRVLAPKFGGFLTFASLRSDSATAPGQPTVSALLDQFRFRSIRRSTRVYGVVGWPVAHSLSPLIHNAGFEAVGHDGVYLPLPVAVGSQGGGDEGAGFESFKATIGELVDHAGLDFAGCSVTLPHKENLVRMACERGWELDETAAAIGAANTLVVLRGPGGAVTGARVVNTDVDGILEPLARVIGGQEALRGQRVAIVGAGGAARAAAYSLARAGAAVTVYNRTESRASAIAEVTSRAAGVEVVVGEWSRLGQANADVFINCTSVGMTGGPAPDASPVPVRELSRGGTPPIAFDTVYTPRLTPFILAARAAGWRTIEGAEMFVAQAARQSSMWTGRDAPRELFAKLVDRARPPAQREGA